MGGFSAYCNVGFWMESRDIYFDLLVWLALEPVGCLVCKGRIVLVLNK